MCDRKGYGHELYDLRGDGPEPGKRSVRRSASSISSSVAYTSRPELEMETLLVKQARNNGLQNGAAGRAVASL